jgi:hypothetical protein
MLSASDIVDAGILVRERLEALVGPDAPRVRARLDELLSSSLGEDELAERIRELLLGYEGLRDWLRARDVPSAPDADEADEELLGRPGSPSPTNGAGTPRAAYTRIDCPDEVAVDCAFDVVVGLSADADPTIFGSQMELPADPTKVWVHVTADGLRIARGGSWRHELSVEPGCELPFTTLRLTAEPQQEPEREARIQALFSIDGQAIGFGSRRVLVVSDPAKLGTRTREPPEPSGAATLPVQATAPDLTVVLRTGSIPGSLMWTFETREGLDVPDHPIETTIGQRADQYAQQLIRGVNAREGRTDLFPFLRGVAMQIADQMPPDFFALLHAVGSGLQRPPLVQLLTEEPYIPWELAWLDPPLGDGAPSFLSAQATVGRWVTGVAKPTLPPPENAVAETMAVVFGKYEQVPGWARLVAAEEEAAELAARYGAQPVDAVMPCVLACLDGDPRADVLHFALHGNYDPSGGQDGLVLVDRATLDPVVVSGYELAGAPFVFLNACQVGTGREILGDYAGLAKAFLRAGACAVVAPLWSVHDTVAKQLALHFYERVRAGARPAEVLRAGRVDALQGADPSSATSFAYQFFGHPAMTIRRQRP